MKLRIALIWFSCFCWASANFSSMPRFSASDLIDSVFAVRQALSAPIGEKPTTSFLSVPPWALDPVDDASPPESPLPQPALARPTTRPASASQPKTCLMGAVYSGQSKEPSERSLGGLFRNLA